MLVDLAETQHRLVELVHTKSVGMLCNCFTTALLLYYSFNALLLLEHRLAALVIWGCAMQYKTKCSKK